MEKHYTKEDLELYRHRQLSVLGRIACTAHLKECQKCTALLDELKEEDQLIQQLRSSIKIFDELAGASLPKQHRKRKTFERKRSMSN